MEIKNIRNTIIRFSQYKNALNRLRKLGFTRVFSDNLADATGISAPQIRKDFSHQHIKGSKKGGYLLQKLLDNITTFLGNNTEQKVIVAGVGKMGSALMNYPGFKREGMKIVAGFDNKPEKWDRESEIPTLPASEMADYIKKHSIKNAVLTVPDYAAQQTYEQMVAAGVRGILNFAPINLKSTDEIIVSNVNLASELESIIYFTNAVSDSGK